MKKEIAFIVGFLFISKLSFGQVPFTHPEHNVNSQQDFGYSTCESNGYFFTCGTTDNTISGTLDVTVTCRDRLGWPIWSYTYDVTGNHEFAGRIRPTPDGVVITGTTGGLADHFKEVFVMTLGMTGSITAQGTFTPANGANLYGFDVVYEPYAVAPTFSSGTFIVVGMGQFPDGTNSEPEGRFGFAMQLDNNLTTVNWSKWYTKNIHGGAWYDCINNVDRIDISPGVAKYYFTGSVTDFCTNCSSGPDQAVMNMLIDPAGTKIWDVPFHELTHTPSMGTQYSRGTNALYDGTNLYLLYHSSLWHSSALAKVNLMSGVITAHNVLGAYAGHSMYNMVWADNAKTNIVVGGYLHTTSGSSNPSYMVHFNPASLVMNWQRDYKFNADQADLYGMSYDFSLTPMYSWSEAPLFFVPNMIVRNDYPAHGSPYYQMASLTNTTGNPFDLFMMQTYSWGDIQAPVCFDSLRSWTTSGLPTYSVDAGTWQDITITPDVQYLVSDSPNRTITYVCNSYLGPAYKTTSIKNISNNAVSLFPNPATDHIDVQIPDYVNITNVYVIDLLGKKTEVSYHRADNKLGINISALAAGMYNIQLEGEETTNVRFIKQ